MLDNTGRSDRTVTLSSGRPLPALGGASTAAVPNVTSVPGAIALTLDAAGPGAALTRRCLAYRPLGVDTAGAR